MRLLRIVLRRVPGIDPPFTVDHLPDGINVVVGPNGSGKTSLRKAVAAMLWPQSELSKRIEIESEWHDGERKLDADRQGGRVTWRADGHRVDAPAVPDAHLASCYTLGVGDLLLSDNKADQAIAKDIRVAMSGGYDVRAVAKEQFTLAARFGAREQNAYRDATAAYYRVRAAQRDLADEENRLASLREDAGSAEQAQRALSRIDDALEAHELRTVLGVANARIAELPCAIANIAAQDPELLGQLESALDNANGQVDRQTEQMEREERAIVDSGLGEKTPTQGDIDAANGRLLRLKTVEGLLAETGRRRGPAQARVREARRRLTGTLDVEAVRGLNPPALDEVEQFIRQRDRSRAKRDALAQRIDALAGRDAHEDSALLKDATDLLRDWLAAPLPAGPQSPLLRYMPAVGLVVLGVALAVWRHLAWLSLAGAGVGAAVALFLVWSAARRETERARARCEERFLELAIDGPVAWTPEQVRALLRDLDRRLGSACLGEAAQEDRAHQERRLREHAEEEAALEAKGAALRAALGVNVLSDLALHEVAAACRQYLDATTELLTTDAQIGDLERERAGPRDEINQFLQAYGYDPATDAAGLDANLKALQRRLDKLAAANEQFTQAKIELGRAKHEQASCREKIRRFYEVRGLDANDRARLESLLENLPEYSRLTADRSKYTGRIAALEAKLDKTPDLLAADAGSLAALRRDAQEKSGSFQAVSEEIGRITQRIDEAISGTVAEQALSEVDAARDALLDAREQAQFAAAGRFLLEQVDKEHEKQSRPKVLEQAMQYFAAFTHNAYELTLADDEGAGFLARDTSGNRYVELSQLSDGTRIQLLLAVRLAFATSAERDAKIPLILDEALSTSDPERFLAVAQALAMVARDGRQIFYLTSNPMDVAAWQAAMQRQAGNGPAVTDLGLIRWRQAAVAEAGRLTLPEPRSYPKPQGMTSQAYGIALGVPPALPHAPIESLHLFYLLRGDLALLYRLVSVCRVHTLGNWESLSRSGRAPDLLPLADCRRLDVWCACARAAHAAGSIGRGKPLDQQSLEDSDAVSDTFMPVVTAVNQDVAGDPGRLINVIADPTDERVKGFRKKSLEKLTEYLQEHGYLDDRPTLEIAEVYARAIEPARKAIEDGVVDEKACLELVDWVLAAFGYEYGSDGVGRPVASIE